MRGKKGRELRQDAGIIHKEFQRIPINRIYNELKWILMGGEYLIITKISIRRHGKVRAMVFSIKEELNKGDIAGVFGMDNPALILRMLLDEGVMAISEPMYVHDELGIKSKDSRVIGYKFSREARNSSGLKSKGKTKNDDQQIS